VIYLVLCLLATVILPTIACIWSVVERSDASVVYHWNVVCFFNCIMLAAILLTDVIRPLLIVIKNPDDYEV
jgi:hypothetical protein